MKLLLRHGFLTLFGMICVVAATQAVPLFAVAMHNGKTQATEEIDNLYLAKTADSINHAFWRFQPEYDPLMDPVLFTAMGASDTGEPIENADQVNVWRYVAAFMQVGGNGANASQPPLTLETSFAKGEFQVPLKIEDPWAGAEFLSITQVKMTLKEALALVREAGYPEPFNYMSLFKPLVPHIKEFLYHFEMEQMRVFVGVDSKTVFTEPTEPPPARGQSVLPENLRFSGCSAFAFVSATVNAPPPKGTPRVFLCTDLTPTKKYISFRFNLNNPKDAPVLGVSVSNLTTGQEFEQVVDVAALKGKPFLMDVAPGQRAVSILWLSGQGSGLGLRVQSE